MTIATILPWLALLWLSGITAAAVFFYRKQQQHIQSLHAELAQARHTQHALMESTVGMGRRLQKLIKASEGNRLLSKTDEATLSHAVKLIELGADTNDLINSCGLPRAEAELLVSLKRKSDTSSPAE